LKLTIEKLSEENKKLSILRDSTWSNISIILLTYLFTI